MLRMRRTLNATLVLLGTCGEEPVCGVRPIWGQSTLETSEADFYPETNTKTIKAKPERRVDSGHSE